MSPDLRVSSLPLPQEPAFDEQWQPTIFDLALAADRTALAKLRTSGRVWRTHDTMATQLADLVSTRAPGQRLAADERQRRIGALLGDVAAEDYGRWVFYPWAGHLVHLLGPVEMRELRLDRNRDKITRAEQARLATLTVGVVGLSVGNAIAYAMAQEGSVGHLKLADFDRLDMSNMNRLQSSVHEIGVRKTVMAARHILELDPYQRLSLYPDGLTEANIDDFVTGVPRLDVLIDECDDWMMKLMMRHKARAAGIPVLMETSDRGMFDVERFDREPDRPLLHGLAKITDPGALRNMQPSSRIAVALDVVGPDRVSARCGAALLEMDRTLSTWPQLAADVALGAATVATAVRRIALGQPMDSGRRYVDLDQLLTEPPQRAPDPAAVPAGAPEPGMPAGVSPLMTHLLEQAILAPSGGNNQPWRFRVAGDTVWVIHDPARDGLLESGGRSVRVALGAAVENMVIAAAARGVALRVTPFPDASDPRVAAAVTILGPAGAAEARLVPLAPFIQERRTNRRRTTRAPLTPGEIAALAAAAGEEVSFDLRASAGELAEAADLLAEGDRLRLTVPELHADCVAELRFSAAENARTRDGIDVATLAMSPVELAVATVITRPDVMALIRAQGTGSGLGAGVRAAIAGASAVVMIRARATEPAAELAGGRAIERMWLAATAAGLAIYPLCVLPILIDLAAQPAGRIFNPDERARLSSLDARLELLFPIAAGQPRLFLFQVSRAHQIEARSLRLPLAGRIATADGAH